MLYSILDLFRRPLESAELVRRADILGFHRYWIGEHHVPTQCPNPVLLGSVLLGLTEQIRVGTGALGLFSRSPLMVAEDVRLIHTLFGDRFDLGISRGLVGSVPGKERALLLDGRDEMLLRQEFPERLRHLCALLSESETAPPPLWLVGSSLETARNAAALGIGFCTSLYHAHSIPDLELALAVYRDEFQPVSGMAEPYSILVQSGVCAASDAEARAALRAFFLPPEGAVELTPKPMGPWLFAGTGERCREAIEAAIARFRPDEIMIHNLIHEGLEMELRSLDLLAAELQLTAPLPPAVALGQDAARIELT